MKLSLIELRWGLCKCAQLCAIFLFPPPPEWLQFKYPGSRQETVKTIKICLHILTSTSLANKTIRQPSLGSTPSPPVSSELGKSKHLFLVLNTLLRLKCFASIIYNKFLEKCFFFQSLSEIQDWNKSSRHHQLQQIQVVCS